MNARTFFVRALSVSIINQFKPYNRFCLCLASVHLPYPFHLVLDVYKRQSSSRISICACAVLLSVLAVSVPARKDWNDVLRQQKDIPNRRFIAETITLRELPTAQPVPMLRMADVELTSVDWLWFPYIPFGKPVSYTHLDVYKRQARYCSMSWCYPTSSLSIVPRLTKRHETAWS